MHGQQNIKTSIHFETTTRHVSATVVIFRTHGFTKYKELQKLRLLVQVH